MSDVLPPTPEDRADGALDSDHERATAIVELAAAEPDGLDRLDAGDLPEASWLAGHLAGCSSCASEYRTMRRMAGAVRSVVRETPPPELRARTLALVRSVGRERGGAERSAPASQAAPGEGAPREAALAPTLHVAGEPVQRPSRSLPLVWLAGVAATVLISVGLTTAIVGAQLDDRLAQEQAETAALATVTQENIALLAQPDARVVELTGTSSAAAGSLLYSPSRGHLSVTATGLAEPPPGGEYGCWVEIDGSRQRVGRMWFAGGIAYWVGPAAELGAVRPGWRFGVTLVSPDGTPAGDVLTGDL